MVFCVFVLPYSAATTLMSDRPVAVMTADMKLSLLSLARVLEPTFVTFTFLTTVRQKQVAVPCK